MSIVSVAAEAEAGGFDLPFPAVFFGVIVLAIFLAFFFVLWSYRDVANRHARRSATTDPAHDGHGTAADIAHDEGH